MNISSAPSVATSRAISLDPSLAEAVHASYADFLKSKPTPARVVSGLESAAAAYKLLGQLRRYALSQDPALGIWAPGKTAVQANEVDGTYSLTFETRPKREFTKSAATPAGTVDPQAGLPV